MSTTFTDLTRSLTRGEGAYAASVPEDWLQGRTAYGGLSAALALAAARAATPDLPPLRTAQVAFVGPASGELHVTTTTLRAGKSMTFVGTDAAGDAGACTRCLFGFGAARAAASARAAERPP